MPSCSTALEVVLGCELMESDRHRGRLPVRPHHTTGQAGPHTAVQRVTRRQRQAIEHARHTKKGRPVSERPFDRPSFRVRLAFRHRVGILAEEIERRRFFRREFGFHLLRLLPGDFRQELDIAIALQARSSGNQPAHDHVFLQAA
jgi:hypothetical protein